MLSFPELGGAHRPEDNWIVKRVKHSEPTGTYTIAIVGQKDWRDRTEFSYDVAFPDRNGTSSTSVYYSSMAEALRKAVAAIREQIADEKRATRMERMSPTSRASLAARKKASAAFKFFYKHAGYSHGPGQTVQQGRMESAKRLARAEQYIEDAGWKVEWSYDDLPYEMGDAETEMPNEVLMVVLRDENGHVIESLGGIGDPDNDYRRVVEAELALEAMPPEMMR